MLGVEMSYDIDLIDLCETPLDDDRCAELVAVLNRYGAKQADTADAYSVRWADGTGLSLYSTALFQHGLPTAGLLSPLGGLSERFCDFLYDFARASGCVARPDVIPRFILVTHPAHLPESFATDLRIARVSSGRAVLAALSPSYDGWRNQVRDAARQLNDALLHEPPEARDRRA